ncbi:MAG: serine acetyltransferase [Myxococcales bacterium]|nr:serine acetyltransferase [Myxococcales bacterium]
MSSEREARHRRTEAAIDAIVESYASDLEINNLGVVALPNARAVQEALNHLRAALFIGFYSTRELSPENLRYVLSSHLYPAEEILVEQIERARLYEERIGRTPPKPADWSENVVVELFRRFPRLRELANGDVMAAYHGDPAACSVEEVVFAYPSILAISTYRIAHELRTMGVPLIPRIMSETAHAETGIDINPGAVIGERFFIDHGTGVVIGETTVIGNDVKLYQGVTLGALSIPRTKCSGVKRHPTLEDEVTVYAGASIHGGETVIGRGSAIGANVWLTHSVPPGSRIYGRPREPAPDGESR